MVDRGSVLVETQVRRGEGGDRAVGGKDERQQGTVGEREIQTGIHGRNK